MRNSQEALPPSQDQWPGGARAQHHPGYGRNTADRNYRPGHDDKKEACQGSAQEASVPGVRKPHSAVRSRGRGRQPPGALNFCFRIGKITNEGADAPSLADKAPLLGSPPVGSSLCDDVASVLRSRRSWIAGSNPVEYNVLAEAAVTVQLRAFLS